MASDFFDDCSGKDNPSSTSLDRYFPDSHRTNKNIVCGIGNGCALGAVVTTPKIAQALASRIPFNTFGGNPVATAQARAVLEVIDREGLQANSLRVGNYLKAGFDRLARKDACPRNRAR